MYSQFIVKFSIIFNKFNASVYAEYSIPCLVNEVSISKSVKNFTKN